MEYAKLDASAMYAAGNLELRFVLLKNIRNNWKFFDRAERKLSTRTSTVAFPEESDS